MVFQKYSLYPWLNAADNVAFGMRLQGLKPADVRERTAYFLEVVGLQEAAYKTAGTLRWHAATGGHRPSLGHQSKRASA